MHATTSLPTSFLPPATQYNPSFNVFARLNLEWAAMRHDPEVGGVVARWAATDPALAGLGTLALIEAAKAGPFDDRLDAMFVALARRASGQDGDAELAARILLQLMLPKVAVLAGWARYLIEDPSERAQLAVCSMYQAIRTLPLSVTHHVPPNLAGRAQRLMRQETRALLSEVPVGWCADVAAEPASRNPEEELAELLAWAVTEQIISADDATLLAARYRWRPDGRREGGPGTSWRDFGSLEKLAAQVGLTPDALKKRCSRATRRLAGAVAAYAGAAA